MEDGVKLIRSLISISNKLIIESGTSFLTLILEHDEVFRNKKLVYENVLF